MFTRLSIRRKLFLVLAGTGLVALLLAGGSQRLYEQFTFKNRVVTQLEALSDMVAVSIYAAVDFNDATTAKERLAALSGHPDLLSARLFALDGREFARWVRPGTAPAPTTLAPVDGEQVGASRGVVTRTLKFKNARFARLVLESSFATQQREFDTAMQVLAVVGLVACGLCLLAAGLLQRLFTAPLIKLTHAAESVHASGDFSLRAEVKSGDEIGRLATSLNTMLAGIETRDRALAASHAFQRAMVEGSGVAVISTDPTGIVRTFNPAAEHLLGYRAAEVVGRRTPAAWHDQSEVAQRAAELTRDLQTPVAPGFETFVARVRHGPPEGREWTFLHRDGQRVPVYLVISALRDDAGAIIGYCGLATDLTARKASEAALRESELRFRNLADNTIVGMLVVQDGLVRYFNPPVARMFGFAADANVADLSIMDLVAPEYRAELGARTHAVLQGEKVGIHPGFEAIRQDGSRFWVQTGPSLTSWNGRPAVQTIVIDSTGTKVHARVREILFENLGGTSGQAFFERLAVETASLLGAARVFVSRLGDARDMRMIPLVLWDRGQFLPEEARSHLGGPAEVLVKEGAFSFWPDVRSRFPERAHRYAEWGVTSYAGIPLRTPAGEPIGTIGLMFDHPVLDVELVKSVLQLLAARAAMELERVAAERTLRASEERFRLVWETAAEAMRLIDATGRVVAVNAAYCRMIGLPREKLMGQPMEIFAAEADRAAIRLNLAARFQTRTASKQWEREFNLWDGRRIWVEGSTSFVETDPAQPLLLGIFRDISERKAAVEAIRQLNADLERRVQERTAELAARITEVEQLNTDLSTSQRLADRAAAGLQEANSNLLVANQELEAFSYSVSHDLRAPLRNITGFIELMRKRTDGKLDAESNRFLSTVIAETARMGLLIDDLLTFSRLGRTALKLETVRLTELIDEVKLELHQDLANRAIEWRLAPLPLVQGDRALLRQVISNLVGNAVKFTRQRAVAVIEIGASASRPGDPTVTIFVRDNGAGFNPKYVDKLFGVFQRLHNSRDFEGTGIGLANVKRIVTRHDGRVWAEGAINQGATFYFTVRPAAGADRSGP